MLIRAILPTPMMAICAPCFLPMNARWGLFSKYEIPGRVSGVEAAHHDLHAELVEASFSEDGSVVQPTGLEGIRTWFSRTLLRATSMQVVIGGTPIRPAGSKPGRLRASASPASARRLRYRSPQWSNVMSRSTSKPATASMSTAITKWPGPASTPGERVELIGGEIFDMTPIGDACGKDQPPETGCWCARV